MGEPNQKKGVTAADVQDFANAIRKTLRYKQDNLRDGIMLAWAFRPRRDGGRRAAAAAGANRPELHPAGQVRIDSPRFREHVTALSTQNADYENFLTFVQPPEVEVGHKRIACAHLQVRRERDGDDERRGEDHQRAVGLRLREAVLKHAGVFVRARGKKEPELQAQYEFPTAGKKRIACKVQDDMGGEGLWTAEIEVS